MKLKGCETGPNIPANILYFLFLQLRNICIDWQQPSPAPPRIAQQNNGERAVPKNCKPVLTQQVG